MSEIPCEATVFVAFHPVSDVVFEEWAGQVRTVADGAPGFRHLSVAHDLQAAVSLTFSDESLLQQWLDSPGWSQLREVGLARGIRREFSDLVVVDGDGPPTGVGIFVHEVDPVNRSGFAAAQRRLMDLSAAAAGFEYSILTGPRAAGDGIEEWTAVAKFRTDALLAQWRDSPERAAALGELRSNLEQEFSSPFETNSFGSIVRVTGGRPASTPDWKVGMMVLLVLYPTVMVLSRFVGPFLDRWGAEPWLSMWLSQILSVSLLTYLLMPLATAAFSFWLDPYRGSSRRVSVIGAVVVVMIYAATLTLFANVRWLQFWDYV
jgi:uncharacterized protein